MNPWMIAQFGMQLFQGASAAQEKKKQVEAQQILDRADAEAQNVNRDSNNRVQAAVASLSNYGRSLNNQRAGNAIGAKMNALRVNAGRTVDAMVKGNIAQQMQASEQMGQISAMASAAGVGGGSVDMVKRTMRLRRNIQEQQFTQQTRMLESDYTDKATASMRELIGSADMSATVASMDYGVTQAPTRYTQGALSSMLSNPNLDFTLLRDGMFKSPVNPADGMSGAGSMGGGSSGAASSGANMDFFN